MTNRPGRALPLLVVLGLTLGIACDDTPLTPTDPEPSVELPEAAEPQVIPDGGGLLSDRARVLDPARFRLSSTAPQLEAGQFRFQLDGAALDSIARDDVIVVAVDGEPQPRVVLSADRLGDELVLETGPALWSDVVNSGQYGFSAPIGPGPAVTVAGLELPDLNVTPGIAVPPLGAVFDLNLCALADSIMRNPLCGAERQISYTLGATISLAGKLDSLAVLDGDLQVSGSMSLDLFVDGGGIIGGRPPVFSPCNRGRFLGCIATPTGANLIDFLRRYAPNVPEAALPAVRLCIPGSPVRIKLGYWAYTSLGIPYWVLPVFERCRVADFGELPTPVFPSVQHVSSVIQPRVKGAMTFYAEGDGKLGLKIPIPYVAYAAGFDLGSAIKGKASVGFFVDASVTIKNTAGSLSAEFDEELRIAQGWTPQDGWSSEIESIRSEQGVKTVLENPDSAVLKAAFSAEAKIELSLAARDSAGGEEDADDQAILDWLGLGANAGLTFGPFGEATGSREQIHPTDPDIDNWHISTDIAYEVKPEAGIAIPDLFFIPDVPTSWEHTFEFGRVSVYDLWGRANLIVGTTTTGPSPDPDGYTAVVTRADTLPRIIDEGAERLTRAFDHGVPLEMDVGLNEAVVFGSSVLPCTAIYSDAAVAAVLGGGTLALLRKAGVTIPNYATVTPSCNLLIARHTVELTGVAENCTVDGGARREDVWLLQRRFGFEARSDTARVDFDVTCGSAAELGALEVTADVPAVVNGPFEVLVDGVSWGLVEAGATRLLNGLMPGQRTVELDRLPSYCPPSTETVDVIANETAATTITPNCNIPLLDLTGAVVASVTASGAGDYPDAFLVKLDGAPGAAASAARPGIIGDLPALTPSVLLLSDIPGHCRATTRNPRVFALDAERNAVEVGFGTECTAASIDTLVGEVTATAWPTPYASLETADGESLDLTGPDARDFLQLSGATVHLWGVRAGTSMNVYGYTVRSTLGEPRWTGVIMERDGELWLFGERAVKLIDPPPYLQSRVGALVWVAGYEIQPGSIVPEIYGVIREGAS